MQRLVTITSVLAGLMGCAGTGNVSNIDTKYQMLEVGQSKEDLIGIFGEPGNRGQRFSIEALQYCGTGFFSDEYITVWMKSGQVVGFNKTTAADAVGLCSMRYPPIDWASAPDITTD